METVHFGRALYYPHIFPQSRRWLRTAALYHDGIGRIVPRDFVSRQYDRHNGEELLRDFEALAEAGFIEDQEPDTVLPQVSDQFISFIAPFVEGPERKEKLVQRLGSRDWKPYNMYREKIQPELLALLQEVDLVRAVNDFEVEFDSSIGGLYMLFLAKELAKHQPIVSDDPLYEVLTHIPVTTSAETVPVDRGLLLASAIFASVVPIDIEWVDMKDLIKFREDFSDERLAFYEWMAAFRSELAKIRDPKQLEQAIDHYADLIRARMAGFKKKLKLLKLKCANGIFTFSLPSIVTADWGFASKDPRVLIGAGSLVVAGVIANAVLEHGIAKADAPLAYVHSMRKELKPKEYAGELIQLNISGL